MPRTSISTIYDHAALAPKHLGTLADGAQKHTIRCLSCRAAKVVLVVRAGDQIEARCQGQCSFRRMIAALDRLGVDVRRIMPLETAPGTVPSG